MNTQIQRSEVNPSADSSDGTVMPALRYSFLAASDLREISSISWVVKGLLPQTGTGMFYGASGAGKSFLLLDMACCIAEGVPWFGHRTIRSPVFYLCLEGSHGFVGRTRAWEIGHGRTLPKNLRVLLEPTFSLLVTNDVRDLIKAVTSLMNTLPGDLGPPVVIVDTLSRAMTGAEENGSIHMGLALQACSRISQLTGGMTVLAHHPGKDTDRGPRGHSSLVPTVDASILVGRSKDLRTWETKKVKDGTDGIKASFRLETVNMGVDADGDDITSCIVKPSEADGVDARQANMPRISESQRLGLNTFKMAAQEAGFASVDEVSTVSIEAWRVIFYSRCTASSDSGKRNAFHRARTDLQELGFLVENKGEAGLTKVALALLVPR